jgi:hypothetical protein
MVKAQPRHSGRLAPACGLGEEPVEIGGGRRANSAELEAEKLGTHRRRMRGVGGFVAPAPVRRRREIGRVGLQQDALGGAAAKIARSSWLFGKAAIPDIDR